MGHGGVALAGEGLLDPHEGEPRPDPGLQIRTLDSVSFNAAATAYTANDPKLFRLAIKRMRPGYRPAFSAWLALHPLRNPKAPPDPSYLPQYRIPQEAHGRALTAQAEAYFAKGESAAATGDKYVRLTVLLAAVLFLVGIGSRFPVRSGGSHSPSSPEACSCSRSPSYSACRDRRASSPSPARRTVRARRFGRARSYGEIAGERIREVEQHEQRQAEHERDRPRADRVEPEAP